MAYTSLQPCELVNFIFWEKVLSISEKVPWWHTLVWTIRNWVDKTKNILKGDFFSPLEWLSIISNSMEIYNKRFWTDIIENLWTLISIDIMKKLEPIAIDIAKGKNVSLREYKNAAQRLWMTPKEILDDIEMWSRWDIILAGTYYWAVTIQAYMDSFNEMEKTIKAVDPLTKEWEEIYPYYFSPDGKDAYRWMISNMNKMFLSAWEVSKFVTHSAKQDVLRLMESFNHDAMKWMSDFNDEAWKEKFTNMFLKLWEELSLTKLEYKTLITAMNSNWWTFDVLWDWTLKKWTETTVSTLADFKRFSTWVINIPFTTALTLWSGIWYTFNAVAYFNNWLYNPGKLWKLRELMGYSEENIFRWATRADVDNMLSAWLWSWDISYWNKFAKYIWWKAEELMTKMWAEEKYTALAWEGIQESFKWLHNAMDSLFKLQANNSSISSALRFMHFKDEKAFIAYYNNTEHKEALIQELKRISEDFMQMDVWFWWPAVWNISTLQNVPVVKHMQYLNTRWQNLWWRFINDTFLRPASMLVAWIRWHVSWVEWSMKNAFDGISKHYIDDPAVNKLFKVMFYTMYMWHKIQEVVDNEDSDDTVLQRATRSLGTYWRWMNNYLQAMESNRIWRTWEMFIDTFNNKYLEWHKLTAMIWGMFREMSKTIYSRRNWVSMFAKAMIAAGDAFDEWWFNAKLFSKAWGVWQDQMRGMNRYYISQTIASLDSKNVPFSIYDNLSMMFWSQLNSASQIEQKVKDLSDAHKLETDSLRWFWSQLFYNNSILKPFRNLFYDVYDPNLVNEWTEKIFDKIAEMWVLSDDWLLPLEIQWDEKRTKEWQYKISETIKYLWIYWWHKDKNLSLVFSEAGIRNPDNFTETYTYQKLNTLSDMLLKSNMIDKELKLLDTLWESDIKWKEWWLASEVMLRYVMANNWSAWWLILNKMAYNYRSMRERELTNKKYPKADDLHESDKELINKEVAEKYWKYIQLVSLDTYTDLMWDYLEKDPAFDELKKIRSNKKVKGAIAASYKTILSTIALIQQWWSAEHITQQKDIIASIKYLKDYGDEWTMNTVAQAYDLLEQNSWLSRDSKTQLEAKMFKEIAPYIIKAEDSPEYFEKHKEIIHKMLEMQHWTMSQTQQMMDNTYMSQYPDF